jgi:MarR family transcriptional repressor of emrRAB
VLKTQIDLVQSTITRLQGRGLPVPADEMLLFRSLVLVGRALSQINDEAIRPTGLAEAEFRVLLQLFSQPDSAGHPGELCAGAAQSPATITRITDTLVARGLISRIHSDLDRRRMILRVTPEGEALVRRIVPAAFDPVKRLFASLDAGDRDCLTQHLQEIAAAFDALAATAPAAAESAEGTG